MDDARALAGRLREIAETPLFGIIADEMTAAADLIDRLAAPEGVGLTRYTAWLDGRAILSDPTGEWVLGEFVRHDDAIAALATEKTRADEHVAANVRMASKLIATETERDTLKAALDAYDAWDALPTDRGGKDGTKGRAWQKWLAAKARALSKTQGGK